MSEREIYQGFVRESLYRDWTHFDYETWMETIRSFPFDIQLKHKSQVQSILPADMDRFWPHIPNPLLLAMDDQGQPQGMLQLKSSTFMADNYSFLPSERVTLTDLFVTADSRKSGIASYLIKVAGELVHNLGGRYLDSKVFGVAQVINDKLQPLSPQVYRSSFPGSRFGGGADSLGAFFRAYPVEIQSDSFFLVDRTPGYAEADKRFVVGVNVEIDLTDHKGQALHDPRESMYQSWELLNACVADIQWLEQAQNDAVHQNIESGIDDHIDQTWEDLD